MDNTEMFLKEMPKKNECENCNGWKCTPWKCGKFDITLSDEKVHIKKKALLTLPKIGYTELPSFRKEPDWKGMTFKAKKFSGSNLHYNFWANEMMEDFQIAHLNWCIKKTAEKIVEELDHAFLGGDAET